MARTQRRFSTAPTPATSVSPAAPGAPSSALPASWPWWFCAALALWLSLSRLQRNHIADSLLTSLISTLAWTPFFWRQNRYGMLWPLLCSWIHHPLLNVVAIMFCNVAFGLAAHFLLARFLWRAKGPWQWTGLLSIAATLLLGSERYIFETLSPLQFMTTPLSFGLLALYAVSHGRATPVVGLGAVALLALTAWYNPAAPVMLGALLFWAVALELGAAPREQTVRCASWRWRTGLSFLAIGACAAASVVMMRRATYHNPMFDRGLPGPQWRQTAWALLRSLFTPSGDDMGAPHLALASGCATVLLVFTAWRHREAAANAAWRKGLAGPLAAASYGAVISERAWALQENCNARYFFPVLFVALSGTCVGIVGAWPRLLHAAAAPVRRLPVLAATAAIACTVGLRFGPPSYPGVEAWMIAWTGAVGEELQQTACTHVAGRYWDAWPAAFYVNWQRYLRGDPRPFFAVSNYAEATSPMWPAPADWRVGILKQSIPDARSYLSRYGAPPLHIVRETSQLLVGEPTATHPP